MVDTDRIHKRSRPPELCPLCGSARAYHEKYDAYYCPKCNYWLEPICPDRKCRYCKDRPRYPKR